MTDEERHQKVIEAWNIADDKITVALLAGLGKYNNIFMMANSGARGSNRQIKQLAGMRGLMASPNGGTSNCLSKRTSVKVCPYWNTSFPLTVRVKV